MNISLKSAGLALGIIAMSTVSFAQKKNETSAAVEYKKFQPFYMQMMTGGLTADVIDGHISTILAAKKFIDLAAEHPDTKESQKTQWYRGEIYTGLMMILGMDSTASDVSAEECFEISLNSFKMGYGLGNKYKGSIEDAVNEKASLFITFANMGWENKMYAEAAEGYNAAWQYSETINVIDSGVIFNAALCYDKAEKFEEAGELYGKLAGMGYRDSQKTHAGVLASRAYRNAKQPEKAKEIVLAARKENPSDKELLLELVGISIDAGDNEGAQQALNDAITADPNNKVLYYNIGTIYMNMEDNENAEKNLKKALEIDPNYVDAQYQLGAHLFNWALQLKDEASFMKIGDPRIDELDAMSDEKMDGAVNALESYIKSDPNNKDVLKILYKAYHKKGNSEKAKEYKARYEAL